MIKLRTEDFKVMYDHAEREFPNESCGVIIGDAVDSSKTVVRPCRNIQNEMRAKYPDQYSRNADTGYYLDPKELKTAFDDAAKSGLRVIGFYHSHPNHDAYWSAEDHRAAMWGDEPSFPDASHVVISVYDGKVKSHAVYSWDQAAKQFTRGD